MRGSRTEASGKTASRIGAFWMRAIEMEGSWMRALEIRAIGWRH